MKAFRIASIGAGHIANRCHGPSLARYVSKNRDVELTAICDLDLSKAESFAKSWGYRNVYKDIGRMLAVEKPDAVCLVVPERHTAQLARPILEQGIPLLMEKPPGVDLVEVLSLVEAARKGKAIHAVAFNRRHMPLIESLKTLLVETKMDIEQIRYEMVRTGRTEAHFHLTAIHGLDLVRHLANASVLKSHFESFVSKGSSPATRYFTGNALFENGIQAQWMFSPNAGAVVERLALHGASQSFFINLPVWGCLDSPGVLEYYQGGVLKNRIVGNEVAESDDIFMTNGFYAENENF